MTREEKRWCYFNGANGRRRPTLRRIPLLLVILCTLLAGSLATAEHDHSSYSYAGRNGKSSFNHQSSNIRLIDGESVGRIRRARRVTPDNILIYLSNICIYCNANISIYKEELPKDQSSAQPQPQSQQQPQQQPQVQPQQQQQQQQQSKQPQQQQQSQQPQQPQQQAPPTQPTTNTTNASDVTYSTAYSTSEATSTVRPSDPISNSKPDFKKKASQAPNLPATDMTLHVWANHTLTMRNITGSGKEQQSESSTKEWPETDAIKPDDIDIGDISISEFSDMTNFTLTQNNITKTVYDTHQYYNSTFIIDVDIFKKYWVDMDNHPDLKVNHLLSQSHRRAAIVKLKFDFPFYGYNMRNITITNGGFLYTGVYNWMAATQYIAPLMANFDTRLSNDSYVKYADNGTAFTVEWEKMVLQNWPHIGAFTFQVTLYQNGDIVFVYSVIPRRVEQIADTMHPVKVGLSDAYIMDRTVFLLRRKTIYEYHRVNFNRQNIMNCTVIYLKALPTCHNFDNCQDCLTKVSDFECKWCPELNKCSTGTSRQRQEWLLKGCDIRNIKDMHNCPAHLF